MKNIRSIYHYIFNGFATFVVRYFSGLKIGNGTKFKRFPMVLKHKRATIEIGSNTTINSSNYGYHINMFSGCKLYADRPEAYIKIGNNCRIHGSCIHAYKEIVIGDNCLIAANTQIIDGNGHNLSFDAPEHRINTSDEGVPIVIEDNVWIAASCIILGGTKIGAGSIITAGSVVKGDIPSNCIYGGNPAKLIKQY
ncbi:MAG: acyltransferase [Altibacter sp.]|uniref:acyltransferase n=1 Tax=Altibacter sp. TaxID=2024823 RepID=UPI001DF7FFD1|nr:acyltransferase [Altibacter sp.]MBZ0327461.1 acyltransferase [Altibacter sp.]